MPIALPGPEKLPPGPRRDFVTALHALYDNAGQPAVRMIANATRRNPELSAVSHEIVSAMLLGKIPRTWEQVASVVTTLTQLSVEPSDPQDLYATWSRVVHGETPAPPVPPTAPPAVAPGALPDVLDGLPAPELACHAALPAVLDSGFLHLLRINFLTDPPHLIPYESEAELLLSPLFTELAGDLYEMRPDVRGPLLQELVARYGEDRLRKVAALLDHYTAGNARWRANPELTYAQHMTALAVRDPALARQRLEEAERSARGAGQLQREWYVAMRHHLDEQQPAGLPQPPLEDDLTLSSPGSRVLLIGFSRDRQMGQYDLFGREGESLELLHRLLLDPRLGGLTPESCLLLELAVPSSRVVRREISRTTGTLLVYLSDAEAGEGWLPRQLPPLLKELNGCPARRIILIVENHYAESARLSQLHLSRPGWMAIAMPPNAWNFSLTGALSDLIRESSTAEPLTIGRMYREVSDRLLAEGHPALLRFAPAPEQRDNVTEVVLTAGAGMPVFSPEEQRWLQALADYEQAGDLAGVGWSCLRLGDLALHRDDYKTANSRYDLAARAFDSAGDDNGNAEAVTAMANGQLAGLLADPQMAWPYLTSIILRAAELANRILVMDGIGVPLAERLRSLAVQLARAGWLADPTVVAARDRALLAMIPVWVAVEARTSAERAANHIADRGLRAHAYAIIDGQDGSGTSDRATAAVTLSQHRSVLGPDHPDTLAAAHTLARDLHDIGDYEQARALNEDALARRRRVLGDAHPDTRASAESLARNLRALGEIEQAERLEQEFDQPQ